MPTGYTLKNIDELEDQSPAFGLGEHGEARFAREALNAQTIGMAHYRWNPGKRVGFGHNHEKSEELYVVVSGAGNVKLDDDVIQVSRNDVLRVAPEVIREWEAGPDGLELLAFGTHFPEDGTMHQGWWVD